MDEESKKLGAVTARRHPEYDGNKDHWTFLNETYKGGREWFNESNLFKFYKEGTGEYSERKSRAYRFNHTREVVQLVNKYLFRKLPKRSIDDSPQELQDFWTAATLDGRSMNQLASAMDIGTSKMGRIYVVVDSTSDGTARTRQEEIEQGSRVYAYIVEPLDVLDVAYDADGRMSWIVIRETVRDDADPLSSTGRIEEQYRIWTRDGWILITRERVASKTNGASGATSSYKYEVQTGEHKLGIVPVVAVDCFDAPDAKYTSPSLIGDVAYLDRAVANYLSNLDAIIQDQTFSQLAIPVEALDTGRDDQIVEMGTKRVFSYNGAGGGKPFFMSPDVKQPELILKIVKQLVNEIYHSVGVAGERTKQDNAAGIDNGSGVAKAYDFNRVESLLTTKAASLEDAENRIAEIALLYMGQSDGDPYAPQKRVSYPDKFDVRGAEDELMLLSEMHAQNLPTEVIKHQMRISVDKVYPNASESEKKELHAAIDRWPESSAMGGMIGPGFLTGGQPAASNPKSGQDNGQQNAE